MMLGCFLAKGTGRLFRIRERWMRQCTGQWVSVRTSKASTACFVKSKNWHKLKCTKVKWSVSFYFRQHNHETAHFFTSILDIYCHSGLSLLKPVLVFYLKEIIAFTVLQVCPSPVNNDLNWANWEASSVCLVVLHTVDEALVNWQESSVWGKLPLAHLLWDPLQFVPCVKKQLALAEKRLQSFIIKTDELLFANYLEQHVWTRIMVHGKRFNN